MNKDIPDKLFLRGRLPLVKKFDVDRFFTKSVFVGASRLSSLKLTLADLGIPFCTYISASSNGSSPFIRKL